MSSIQTEASSKVILPKYFCTESIIGFSKQFFANEAIILCHLLPQAIEKKGMINKIKKAFNFFLM
jgi:hypothetical protein